MLLLSNQLNNHSFKSRNLMKYLFITLNVLLLIFFSACNTSPKGSKPSSNDDNDSILITKDYHSTGDIWKLNKGLKVVEGGKTKFVRHGENLEYYKTPQGALSSKANYKNGKRDGIYTKYYTDGKVYYQVNYSNGKMDGVKTAYHKNGQVMTEIPYKQGLIGLGAKEYTPDGKLLPTMTLKVWFKTSGSSVTVYAQALNKGRVTKRVEIFEGLLVEGKYAHKGLRQMTMQDGTASITVPKSVGFVQISAKVKSARNNYSLVTKKLSFE